MLSVEKVDGLPERTQTPQNEPEFPLFPKLPIEVRILVWREAFSPGQVVCIGDSYVKRDINGHIIHNPFSVRPRFDHPITLHVNTESRTETQKHYRTIFRDINPDYAPLRVVSAALSFSAARDIFCFGIYNVFKPSKSWFEDFEGNNPGCFDGIKKLQIIGDAWFMFASAKSQIQEPSNAISCFKDLEDVESIVPDFVEPIRAIKLILSSHDSEGVHIYRKWLEAYCKRRKEEYESYKVPTIRITDPEDDELESGVD